MKARTEYDFMIDQESIIPKIDKDGDVIEDEDGEIVQIPDKTPLTYGMFKDLMKQFVDNLKTDLTHLAENDTEEL